MRRLLGLALIPALVLSCIRARADDAQDDLKALQGTWHLVYLEQDGMEIKPKQPTVATTTGNKTVVKAGDKIILEGTFTLDPSTTPKSSDSVYTAGLNKGKRFKAIYKIDGNTTTFCRSGAPDQPRPTEFKTKPGTGQLLAVYKRAK